MKKIKKIEFGIVKLFKYELPEEDLKEVDLKEDYNPMYITYPFIIPKFCLKRKKNRCIVFGIKLTKE